MLGFFGIGLSFAALERLPLGDAAALGFINPILAIFIAFLTLGEQVGRLELLAVAGSSIGIVFVTRPPAIFGSAVVPPDGLGIVLQLCATFAAASVTVLVRKLAKSIHWTVVLFWQGVGQALLSPPVATLIGRQWGLPSAPEGAAKVILYMVAGGTFAVGGQVCMTKGLSTERVGPVSCVRSSHVIAAFVLQAVVTPEEPISLLSIVGALMIITSIVSVMWHRKRGGHSGGSQSGARCTSAPKIRAQWGLRASGRNGAALQSTPKRRSAAFDLAHVGVDSGLSAAAEDSLQHISATPATTELRPTRTLLRDNALRSDDPAHCT